MFLTWRSIYQFIWKVKILFFKIKLVYQCVVGRVATNAGYSKVLLSQYHWCMCGVPYWSNPRSSKPLNEKRGYWYCRHIPLGAEEGWETYWLVDRVYASTTLLKHCHSNTLSMKKAHLKPSASSLNLPQMQEHSNSDYQHILRINRHPLIKCWHNCIFERT